MERSFVALDVETANPDRASICQVGLVKVAGGEIVEVVNQLIDPETWFDPWNSEIHGITSDDICGQPTFASFAPRLRDFVGDLVVAAHTAFDKGAIARAHAQYGMECPTWPWIDTARVVRRTWAQFADRGYGLGNVAAHFGIEFDHHDAAEDARAAALLLLRAMNDTGLDLTAWMANLRERRHGGSSRRVNMNGVPGGPLSGEVVLFTGELSIPRADAANLASALGCDVVDNVSRKVTLFVIGQQDLRKLAGHEKSSKHRKVENLIKQGAEIEILSEEDFFSLMEETRNSASVE